MRIRMKANFVLTCISLLCAIKSVVSSWESWWTYEGISGPDFWGRLNPKWSLCSRGRRQSPIDINPKLLLFDPNLNPLQLFGDHINGNLQNSGRGILFKVSANKSVIFSGGPLSYQYTLKEIVLHYGREDKRGSEHTIGGQHFPAEIQLYAFNSQLYANWSSAQSESSGVLAISVLISHIQQSIGGNAQLKHITHALKNISGKGDSQWISFISVRELLPTLKYYVTYEGSLTQPSCHETVTWIILNKPIYMTFHQFHQLRNTMQTDGHGDNFRPLQPINHRSLRTNINFLYSYGPLTIGSFSWSDCGSSSEVIQIHSLSVTPDPIHIPGTASLAFNASVSQLEDTPLPLSLTIKKKVVFVWIEIPCVNGSGSCSYDDICALLPIPNPCPSAFKTYNIPCQCPIKSGNYSLPLSPTFAFSSGSIPPWLESGDYRIEAKLNDRSQNELLCARIDLTLEDEDKDNLIVSQFISP